MSPEPGQFRWWVMTNGPPLGILRLINQIRPGQSRNDLTVGRWYVEDVRTGAQMLVHPRDFGDEVPEMLVIAEAAR